jgi:hypothetical protein
MTHADHVKAFRLFESARAETVGKEFPLDAWERQHLQGCSECRSVLDLFQRQFRERRFTSAGAAPTARFSVGERVRITGPGGDRGKTGVVTGVIEPRAGDCVYRYCVRFAEGTMRSFFGFEIVREAA